MTNESFRLNATRPSTEDRDRIAQIMRDQNSVDLVGFDDISSLVGAKFLAQQNEYVVDGGFLYKKILSVVFIL